MLYSATHSSSYFFFVVNSFLQIFDMASLHKPSGGIKTASLSAALYPSLFSALFLHSFIHLSYKLHILFCDALQEKGEESEVMKKAVL